MPYREVVKKSLSGFRKALLVFGCYEILLSSAIRHKTQRQRAENRRNRRGLGDIYVDCQRASRRVEIKAPLVGVVRFAVYVQNQIVLRNRVRDRNAGVRRDFYDRKRVGIVGRNYAVEIYYNFAVRTENELLVFAEQNLCCIGSSGIDIENNFAVVENRKCLARSDFKNRPLFEREHRPARN